jgi:protease I
VVIAPGSGQIQGKKGEKIAVDHDLASVSAERFDALVLPGGVANPDTLRTNPQAVGVRKAPRACECADRGDLPRTIDADRG